MQQPDYAYSFDNVMSNETMKTLFANYVTKQALCEETFLFHERIVQYKNITSKEQIVSEAKDIIATFIDNDAQLELNLAAQTRQQLLDQSETQYSADMFDSLLATIKMELKDHYQRFLLCKEMTDHVDACTMKELHESMLVKVPATVSSKESKLMIAVDFAGAGIGKKDVDLLEKWLKADRWQLIDGKQDFATFQSLDKYQFNQNDKGTYLIKTIGIVPSNIAQVLNVFATRSTKYDNYMNKNEQIAFEPKSATSDYPISIVMETFPAIWPVTNRDFVKAYTVIHNENTKTYSIIFKSVQHKNSPPRKGTVRGTKFGIIHIENLHQNSTRYTYLTCTDMQTDSYASKLYWKKMMQTRMKSMQQGVMKSIADAAEATESLGILETLAENVKHEYVNRRSFSLEDDAKPVLKRLVYLSKCTVDLSDDELRSIAQVAHANNVKYNVTGMLLYCQGVFYQVLEGECQNVDIILNKIKNDPRHDTIRIVKEEYGLTENDRNYTNWSMNTVNLDTISTFNPCASIMKNVIHYLSAQSAYQESQALSAISILS